MDFKQQIQILKKSKRVHSKWYVEQYPDVGIVGMDAAEHYLKYGAMLGRNPSRGFNTNYYLETYPDVVASGMNPLIHFTLIGQKEGRQTAPKIVDPLSIAKKEINTVKGKLLNFGFTAEPLAELEDMMTSSSNSATRAMAARELSLWSMRDKTDDGYRKALYYADKARADAPNLEFRNKLATVEVLCHFFLGDEASGQEAYRRADLRGEANPDTWLAMVNYDPTPQGRCDLVNRVLAEYNIPPVALLADETLPTYDRLTSAVELPKIYDGPLVTVLVAAYEAAPVIGTTLRSLQEQTWQNLEILVLDDCSPDNTCDVVQQFADTDPRIKLIRMEKNAGAYVARNHGLDMAAGEYVTIHDADDWSHPLKIETQVRYLQDNAAVMGCLSEQARAFSDLGFTRWTGAGHFIIPNISSFLFRREPMRRELGYWDTARFSADKELIRRFRACWGKDAVAELKTGPLSFQRDSNTSIVADEALGINGFIFGARKEYLDAQEHYRANGGGLRYGKDPVRRPFPIPTIMHPNRAELTKNRHFDVIVASEFRMQGGSVNSCVQEIRAARAQGLKVGVFEMYRYDLGDKTRASMLPAIRAEIDGEQVQVLTFGEEASCDVLVLRYPPILQYKQRYVPKINAGAIKIVINQPPVSDYSEAGVKRYDLETCAANIRHFFGKDATWYPNGPMVREAIETHHADQIPFIHLAPENWDNIIHIPEWQRPPRTRGPKDILRIGRHSRDNPLKWPHTREDVLAIYPEADDVEVHVLGGANAPSELIGHTPDNWVVHGFNAIEPKDFLAEIDVFVFFAHPDWVESFPRTVLEAMAVGVPVILPEIHRPLFGDNALYATPETALALARQLHADPKAYDKHVRKAWDYLERYWSYSMHARRLKAIVPVVADDIRQPA